MNGTSSSTSSTAEVLVQRIKEDLTAFITERQKLAHKEKVGINKLNELNQRQKEILKTIPQTCSALQRVLSETANEILHDANALELELQSSKTIMEVLSGNQDKIIRSVSNSKEALELSRDNYSRFRKNATKFIELIRIATENIRELQGEYDGYQSQIKAVCEEKEIVKLQKLQAEKHLVQMKAEKQKVLDSLGALIKQLNDQKEKLRFLEEKSTGILADKEALVTAIDTVKLYEKQITKLNIQQTLDRMFSETNQHSCDLELKKEELISIENRHSNLHREKQKANDVCCAVESDIVSRKSKIEESKQLHSKMLQKIEVIRKKKLKNLCENETLQSVLQSRQLQLKTVLDELMNLREEEWSLERSNEKDSCSLDQLNDLVLEKKTKLSRVEDLNQKLTSLIDVRSSLNSETRLINDKCEMLRNEQLLPKMEKMKKLECRKEELERKKHEYIARKIEIKTSTLEAKERLSATEAQRDVVEGSLQQTLHRTQRLKSEFEALKGSSIQASVSENRHEERKKKLENERKQLGQEEEAYQKAYDEKVRLEAEVIQNEVKEQLQNVKKQCEDSIVQCSTVLAERLQALRKELDAKS